MESLTFSYLIRAPKPVFCSKVAQKAKPCSRMLDLQKIAPSAKSSRSKVAEHIRDRPLSDPDKENKRQNHKFYFPLFKQLTN